MTPDDIPIRVKLMLRLPFPELWHALGYLTASALILLGLVALTMPHRVQGFHLAGTGGDGGNVVTCVVTEISWHLGVDSFCTDDVRKALLVLRGLTAAKEKAEPDAPVIIVPPEIEAPPVPKAQKENEDICAPTPTYAMKVSRENFSRGGIRVGTCRPLRPSSFPSALGDQVPRAKTESARSVSSFQCARVPTHI